jgi:uncharacterized membrane protein YccC
MTSLSARAAPRRWPALLPAYGLNGLSVACGIGLIQLLGALLATPHLAQVAAGSAVCVSLADTPAATWRTLQRVLMAALLTCAATATATALKNHPLGLGGGVAAVTFVAMMAMAWGPRAGPVSFAPVLALVFALATPGDRGEAWPTLAAALLGAAAYVGWAVVSSRALQARYRRLTVAAVLEATAQLLRSRARVLQARAEGGSDDALRQGWIGGEAVLAERLQAARDLVFAGPETPGVRRLTALLVQAIDLRDTLLASRLDLDLAGSDEVAQRLHREIAQRLEQLAAQIERAREVLLASAGTPKAENIPPISPLGAAFTDPHGDGAVIHSLSVRMQRLADAATRIGELANVRDAALPMSRTDLTLFVAPEGWPLAAIRQHFSFRSPVLRHAVRASIALTVAYFIGRALPWASHAHWLVLSVAVVLRGNLEQTLSRRNARVAGTFLGCLLVVLLGWLHSKALMGLAFLAAVGTAHAFVLVRYLVTATAATVMALLQAHGTGDAGGFPIAERLADTVLGALLAWAFSYVLPSWERRQLRPALERALTALRDYALLAVTPAAGAGVQQRLARLRAYDALGALAAAAQRSSVEPRRVQLPLTEMLVMLDHAYRLMAHLSVVRLTLSNRAAQLSTPEVGQALDESRQWLTTGLQWEGAPQAPSLTPEAFLAPERPPAEDPQPWLLRRLGLCLDDAWQVRRHAEQIRAVLPGPAKKA